MMEVEQIKDNPDVIDGILEEFTKKYGRRVYTKNELDIVKLENINDKNN